MVYEVGTDRKVLLSVTREAAYRVYLTGKFSRGVEHFYPAIERQAAENKRVKDGFRDALVKAVGEANRGSL